MLKTGSFSKIRTWTELCYRLLVLFKAGEVHSPGNHGSVKLEKGNEYQY